MAIVPHPLHVYFVGGLGTYSEMINSWSVWLANQYKQPQLNSPTQ